jgi:cyanophycin synthetase
MRELGRVAARYFDDVIVREDYNLRGREPGETARIVVEGVKEGMKHNGRVRNVDIVLNEMDSIQAALARSRPGDVVVLCVDKPAEVWHHLEGLRAQMLS